ncbi:MAG: type IV toxin-antitoxin system AbiEi family antitoxin domain-containing protein [Solirubrobacteraceae bacterium]
MARPSAMARLAVIAEDQWGLLTRQQAQAAGIARATLDRLAANSLLERVDHGVYRLAGAPIPDHMELRAAWLRLAPDVPRWQRTLDQGVVSHRSAAAMYSVGDLPADRHEFTVPTRRQSRRSDVRFHVRPRGPGKWIDLRGLPVTRPSRIASDLLIDNEDPEAVAHIVAASIREVYDYPGTFAEALAPCAARFGLRRGDGLALLEWLLGLAGYPDSELWLSEARRSLTDHSHGDEEADGWSKPRSVTLGQDV